MKQLLVAALVCAGAVIGALITFRVASKQVSY